MTDFQITDADGNVLDAMVEFDYRGWKIAAVRILDGSIEARAIQSCGNSGRTMIEFCSIERAIEYINAQTKLSKDKPFMPTGKRGLFERISRIEFVFPVIALVVVLVGGYKAFLMLTT